MKILLIIFLILQTGISIAQNFEITVLNKNSQPMPYAYVLINNKPVEITDTNGIAIIPQNKLMNNDTISVSYLGAYPTNFIYKGDLDKSKKHIFFLDESAYNLNEVVITDQDFEKLFRKSTKSIPTLNYNCKMGAKFDMKLSYPNHTDYSFFGTFEANNDSRLTHKFWAWFDPPIKFITDSDTTRMLRSLNYRTHEALNHCILSLWKWQHSDKKMNPKPIYSYLGEKNSYNIFRITYPGSWWSGFYYQVIFYVNKETKYIKTVEIEAFNSQADKGNNLYKYSIKYDCEPYTHKKPKMNTIYLPVKIFYSFQIIDKLKFDLKISDVSINTKKL